MKAWQQYQEDVRDLFRSLGLDAETDFTVEGVRTSHDIDVFVSTEFKGFRIKWLVECKLWKTPVTKLHVLALREMVADVGADRGIILSESGFQMGAQQAANLTNVHLASISTIGERASKDFSLMEIYELYDRAEDNKRIYWDIPKPTRIKYGLRPDVGGSVGYSGNVVSEFCLDVLAKALRGTYPFRIRSNEAYVLFGRTLEFENPKEVLIMIKPLLKELSEKLDLCVSHGRRGGG